MKQLLFNSGGGSVVNYMYKGLVKRKSNGVRNIIWKLFTFRKLSSSAGQNKQESQKYCLDLVKTNDYESYLIGLMFPREYRRMYYAIRSFNIEIAQIKDQCKGRASTGRLRYKWWAEFFDEVYSDRPLGGFQQPVMVELINCIKQYNLQARWFQSAIEGRMKEFYVTQPATMSDLEDHVESTQSSLLYLCLEAMNIRHEQTEFMASHVGVSYGIANLIRSSLRNASQNEVYFPVDSAMKVGFNATVLKKPLEEMNDADVKLLKEIVYDVASQAYGHLDKARGLQSHCDRNAIPVMLPSIITSRFLEDLRKVDFNILHPTIVHYQSNYSLLFNLLKSTFLTKI